MREFEYGTDSNGNQVMAYELTNKQGMKVTVLNYGATLAKLEVLDQSGTYVDTILGFDDVSGYEAGDTFQGAIVGRIANRIGGAKFTLNEVEYQLEVNNASNNLHSGVNHYHTRIWNVNVVNEQCVEFSLHSPDGDQGYPGNLEVKVRYTLSDEDELSIHYTGVSDADTIINMTNHSYFNLDGFSGENVLEQTIWVDADAFTRADLDSIPTGEIVAVEGTPMDLREKIKIGSKIGEEYEALLFGNGYDHNWVLNNKGAYQVVAGLHSEKTGIQMEVLTDLPGVQVYTGNFLGESEIGKGNIPFVPRAGVCFETQLFPDAIHHENFKSPVLKAGDVYETTTTFRFTVQ